MSEPTRMYDLGPEAVEKLKGLNEDKAKMFSGVPGWMVFSVKTEHLDDNGGEYVHVFSFSLFQLCVSLEPHIRIVAMTIRNLCKTCFGRSRDSCLCRTKLYAISSRRWSWFKMDDRGFGH